ncbi:MAG TPA: NAD(P)H-dependent oxidoreductase [Candidatus Paceibacterota bacterium]|nr:NAD(P)H-dependent oxidoreductase [Candidatus Paceibacterota bacterium]
MKRGILKKTNCLCDCSKKPIKIVGVMTSNRSKYGCAREDPIANELLKVALKEAEKNGAKTEIIDLRMLKIGPCKECYSSCPAQCRFSERSFQCDCYSFKKDFMFLNSKEFMSMEDAYDKLDKKTFFDILYDERRFAERDNMWIVYKSFLEADGIIFATSTNFYSRPALLQVMISRLTALDGGVEELWGDGKNLGNSIKYAKNPKNMYKQRLYGKNVAFINVSKEGDSVTPNLMKACSMMGMKIIPLSVSSHVNWYEDKTFRNDKSKTLKDSYTLSLAKNIGSKIVEEVKRSNRKYGMLSLVV